MEKNLSLPGNQRYQPKNLTSFFGYDNLYRPWGEIELAKLTVMWEIGMIPASAWNLLSQKMINQIFNITTTATDEIEKKITKHDVNAHVRLMKEILPPEIGRYLHMPFTSYDKIHNAYVMNFRSAFHIVIDPLSRELISGLADLTESFASTLQIGRTHGQQALPITVGFWLATLLDRIVYNYLEMRERTEKLRGKISGGVGAHNAQVALGFEEKSAPLTFEERVLQKLHLKPALISTQILPPEAIAYFLFSATMFSAALAQLGRDGRHLMRTEIAEIVEGKGKTDVGSSTMAHKVNPINFENTEGQFIRSKNEFGKVMDTLISEHQRDLVNSSVMRDFPIILINLVYQLNTLLRKDPDSKLPFIKRIKVNEQRLMRNFRTNAHLIMAEPIYISLQLAGYEGDAHELINNVLTPKAKKSGKSILTHLMELAETNGELEKTIEKIPAEVMTIIMAPEKYVGKSREKALEVVNYARQVI